MVMEGGFTLGGEHTRQYADDVLQNYTPETYMILLAIITPRNAIKNLKCKDSTKKKYIDTALMLLIYDSGCPKNIQRCLRDS